MALTKKISNWEKSYETLPQHLEAICSSNPSVFKIIPHHDKLPLSKLKLCVGLLVTQLNNSITLGHFCALMRYAYLGIR